MSLSSASQSHCTSGCESGWTYYLDESSFSDEKWERFNGGEDSFRAKRGGRGKVVKEEEQEDDDDDGGYNDEDDLSMVSDASSGPPCYEADEYCSVNESCYHSSLGGNFPDQTRKEMKNTAYGVTRREQHLHYQDTGSSCSSSKKNSIQPVLAPSNGNSSAQSKDISQFKKNPDYVHSFSSVRKKPFPGKSGSRKWA